VPQGGAVRVRNPRLENEAYVPRAVEASAAAAAGACRAPRSSATRPASRCSARARSTGSRSPASSRASASSSPTGPARGVEQALGRRPWRRRARRSRAQPPGSAVGRGERRELRAGAAAQFEARPDRELHDDVELQPAVASGVGDVEAVRPAAPRGQGREPEPVRDRVQAPGVGGGSRSTSPAGAYSLATPVARTSRLRRRPAHRRWPRGGGGGRGRPSSAALKRSSAGQQAPIQPAFRSMAQFHRQERRGRAPVLAIRRIRRYLSVRAVPPPEAPVWPERVARAVQSTTSTGTAHLDAYPVRHRARTAWANAQFRSRIVEFARRALLGAVCAPVYSPQGGMD
jgi:hypothetical protein